MNRGILYKLIALSIPFIIIFVLEVTLRFANYGEDYQLFHRIPEKDKPDYLVMNKDLAKKYFKDNNLKSDNQSDLFLKEKPDNTFRVFVQGASTVVGFPFYRSGSFPRMLKHRLSLTFPKKNIEVINTGMTAVNSYTLWDLTEAIIQQQPDLIIIYTGHNEYYGAFGVGSAISSNSHAMAIKSYLKLKKLRIFQLFENTFNRLFPSRIQLPSNRTTTLMEVMAKEQSIPYNSEVFNEGISQFKNNLNDILSKYKKHKIPVILSTVVSNEKDVIPFISDTISNLEKFVEDVKSEKPEAKVIAQNNAHAAYHLGSFYYEINLDTSKKYLHLAKELDLLRFRAPQKINDIIVELSHKYNVSLVDMKSVFEAHSQNGIVGNNLMTEHVHPNIEGQFLMADAFYEKIKELDILQDWRNYIPFKEAKNDIPVTLIDSLQGMIVIEKLKDSWPFNLTKRNYRSNIGTNEGNIDKLTEIKMAQDINLKIRKWNDVMALAYRMYASDKEYEQGLRVAQSLIFEFPEQGVVYRMAGDMCMKLEDYQKAVFYYTRYDHFEASSDSAEKLATAYLYLNDLDLASKTLSEAKSNGLDVSKLSELKKKEIGG